MISVSFDEIVYDDDVIFDVEMRAVDLGRTLISGNFFYVKSSLFCTLSLLSGAGVRECTAV